MIKNSSTRAQETNRYVMKDDVHSSCGNLNSLFFLFKVARPYLWTTLLALLTIILSSVATLSAARVLGYLVETGLMNRNWNLSIQLCCLIIFLESISILTLWYGRKKLTLVAVNTIYLIRSRMFDHLKKVTFTFLDHQSQGRIITRLCHDIEGIEEFIAASLGRLVNAFFLLCLALVFMVFTDIHLGPMMVLMIVPVLILTYGTKNIILYTNRELSRRNSSCNSKLAEFLNGISVIKQFGLESWSSASYEREVDQLLKTNFQVNILYGFLRPLTNFLCTLPLIFLIGHGGYGVYLGTVEFGVFVAFIRYCERFTGPIVILAREIHLVQQALASCERVTSFLKSPVEADSKIIPNASQWIYRPLRGKIQFRNVSMKYEQTEVLKNLSFTIAPGQRVGIIGKTGSGKSSAINLLSKYYPFDKGEILIDDISIHRLQSNFLRQQIGYISQDVTLFAGSLRDNLTCLRPVSDDIIQQKIQDTGLKQVMDKNYLTLDSPILDHGINLGAGVAQLISITRIIMNNPSIFILDEATSYLDNSTEEIVNKAFNKISQGKTSLIIAHRTLTLQNCDYILVFQNGQIIEQGSPTELLKRKGHYYSIIQNSHQLLPGKNLYP